MIELTDYVGIIVMYDYEPKALHVVARVDSRKKLTEVRISHSGISKEILEEEIGYDCSTVELLDQAIDDYYSKHNDGAAHPTIIEIVEITP